jgi:serine O-acetyltransferase
MISAMHFYRLGRWAYEHHVPILPRLLDYASRALFACWVPHRAMLGRGVSLGYGGLGIVIHDDAVIGEGTQIDQGVTIGGNARAAGVARIGSMVYVGAGAKILGPITIGDGAIIGANAVVTRDLPPRCVAVGVPARIVRRDINPQAHLFHRRPPEV